MAPPQGASRWQKEATMATRSKRDREQTKTDKKAGKEEKAQEKRQDKRLQEPSPSRGPEDRA